MQIFLLTVDGLPPFHTLVLHLLPDNNHLQRPLSMSSALLVRIDPIFILTSSTAWSSLFSWSSRCRSTRLTPTILLPPKLKPTGHINFMFSRQASRKDIEQKQDKVKWENFERRWVQPQFDCEFAKGLNPTTHLETHVTALSAPSISVSLLL